MDGPNTRVAVRCETPLDPFDGAMGSICEADRIGLQQRREKDFACTLAATNDEDVEHVYASLSVELSELSARYVECLEVRTSAQSAVWLSGCRRQCGSQPYTGELRIASPSPAVSWTLITMLHGHRGLVNGVGRLGPLRHQQVIVESWWPTWVRHRILH
jgi:hypothetical protein